jgi:hypothetical protein
MRDQQGGSFGGQQVGNTAAHRSVASPWMPTLNGRKSHALPLLLAPGSGRAARALGAARLRDYRLRRPGRPHAREHAASAAGCVHAGRPIGCGWAASRVQRVPPLSAADSLRLHIQCPCVASGLERGLVGQANNTQQTTSKRPAGIGSGLGLGGQSLALAPTFRRNSDVGGAAAATAAAVAAGGFARTSEHVSGEARAWMWGFGRLGGSG